MTNHHNTSPPATFDVFAELAAAMTDFDVEALTSAVGWRCLHCDGRLRATHLDPEEWVQRIVLAQLVEAASVHWCGDRP